VVGRGHLARRRRLFCGRALRLCLCPNGGGAGLRELKRSMCVAPGGLRTMCGAARSAVVCVLFADSDGVCVSGDLLFLFPLYISH
jgi:hypothetical protein